MEMEINELPPEERQVFLEDLGFKESGITRLIQTIYSHLGLISLLLVKMKLEPGLLDKVLLQLRQQERFIAIWNVVLLELRLSILMI